MALSLKYVLLGMLADRPAYGYELVTRVETQLPFYSYTAAAVYPALDRLERDSLIERAGKREKLRTVRGNPRVLYSTTPAGDRTLRGWMREPVPLEKSRDELLGKLSVAQAHDLPHLLAMARDREAQLRRKLGDLREAPAPEWTGSGRVPLTLVGAALVRSVEARRIAASIESLQEIRATLEHELGGALSPREQGFQPPRR